MAKEIPLTRGKVAIVDDDWFEMLSLVKWQCRKDNYAQCGGFGAERMHRLIMGAPTGVLVDHINGNTLDNRIANLRICNEAENSRNSSSRIGSSSKYKGVHWCFRSKKWVARIRVGGKLKQLGYFGSEIEASFAYDSAAITYHGSFAKTNHAAKEQQ